MPQLKRNNIVQKLFAWYAQNKRELPWRQERDAYKIWLSEIILQQTRVDQGLPYYYEFTEKFPNITDLAKAPEDEVLRVWQGLGYYSRARNLHKCAKTIVNEYKGVFPSEKEELIKLPGIGPYTASAIASIAFGRKEAVVDGNVMRLISRLYGIKEDISSTKSQKMIKNIVDELIPSKNPDLFNQAVMEFGAIHCTPKTPKCDCCPFYEYCTSRLNDEVNIIPLKARKVKIRTRFFIYLILEVNNKIFMTKRDNNDIWRGLYEFILIETDTNKELDELEFPEALIKQPENWKIEHESNLYKHVLSHQHILARFVKLKALKNFKFNIHDWELFELYSKTEIEELPKSILIDRYLGEKII